MASTLSSRDLYALMILPRNGQNGLKVAQPAAFGAAAGRITLDQIQFATFHLLADAVPQLARQTAAAEHGLAFAQHVLGLAGRFASFGRQDALADQCLGRFRVFFQVLGQRIAHGRVDDAFHLAVAQLGLRLAFELRVRDADGDDGRQPFAEIVAGGRQVLEQVFLLAVVVQRPRQRGAKSGDVRAAFDGADVVHVRVHVLRVLGRVLHGHLEACPFDFAGKEHHVPVQRIAGPVQVLDVLDDPALEEELFAFVHAFVAVADPNAGIQKRQLLQPLVQRVEVVLARSKDGGIGLERGLRPAFLGGTDAFDRTGGNTPLVFLLVDMPVAVDLDFAPLRQEIDHGHTHAVQTAGGLIRTLLELAAKFQDAHHAFERGHLAAHFLGQLIVRLDRDPATIVLDRHRTIRVDGDVDVLGIAGHGFVDRVVHHFVDQVVQPPRRDVADVHGRAFAHVLPVGQVLQVLRTVVFVAALEDEFGGGRRNRCAALPVRVGYRWVVGPCYRPSFVFRPCI